MADKEELAGEQEAAGAEAEMLKQEKEARARQLADSIASTARLEAALASRDNELAELQQELTEVGDRLKEVSTAMAQAVASYKALVVQSNPGVLAELITGDTVAAVDQSLENARTLISRVRQEIEDEASQTRVPAGAPQRTPPDLSALSAREKIQYAIGGNR